jgi:hypothetical protein
MNMYSVEFLLVLLFPLFFLLFESYVCIISTRALLVRILRLTIKLGVSTAVNRLG